MMIAFRSLLGLFLWLSLLLAIGFMPRPAPVGAVVGAWVELHVVACPPGYAGETLFEDCHENQLPGVTFVASNDNERYEVTSNENGTAFFNDFYTAGPLTIAEQMPTGNFTGFEMHCSSSEGQATLAVTDRGNGRAAASIELPQWIIDSGTGVYCDWYYFQDTAVTGVPGPEYSLGSTRSAWEEIHGPGVESGMVTLYADGRYVVGFTNGHVTSVTVRWETSEAQSITGATSELATLLPSDAELVGIYELPSGPENAPEMHVERYVSSLLTTHLSDQPPLWDGSILVVYELADGGERPIVTSLSIVAGTAPDPSSVMQPFGAHR